LKNNPLVGILAPNKQASKEMLEVYQPYRHNNLDLFAFTASEINWKRRHIKGLSYKRDQLTETEFPFPDAIYNRMYNKRNNTIRRLENIIGSKCFNVINWFSKWRVHYLLKETTLSDNIPDTFLYSEVDSTELLEKYKLVYLKACYGYQGKQVYRIKLLSNDEVELGDLDLTPRIICPKSDLQKRLDEIVGASKFILQEGIQFSHIKHQPFDLRVMVQKDITGLWKVSTIACRIYYEFFPTTNVFKSIYDADKLFSRLFPGEMKYETLIQSAKEFSVLAAQSLELDIGLLGEIGVDFGMDRDGKLWVIEVNGKPLKSLFEGIPNYNYEKLIYGRPMEFAYYLSNNSP